MKKSLMAMALLGGFGFAGQAQAALVEIGVFSGNDCGGQGGFSNCYATQSGTQQGNSTDPADKASPTIYKRNSSNNQPTGSQDFGSYPTIDGSEFVINYTAATNTLSFTYTPNDVGDPAIHYVAVKQANGFVLFYDSEEIYSGSFSLNTWFARNPGWSHITFFDTGRITPPPPIDPVPEPMSLALFGLGLAGLGAVSRRRKAKA